MCQKQVSRARTSNCIPHILHMRCNYLSIPLIPASGIYTSSYGKVFIFDQLYKTYIALPGIHHKLLTIPLHIADDKSYMRLTKAIGLIIDYVGDSISYIWRTPWNDHCQWLKTYWLIRRILISPMHLIIPPPPPPPPPIITLIISYSS